jgi:cyclopropane fatty-acyl-phospholipid synthase-like methyltransferase
MLRKLWFNIAYLRKPIWDTGISPKELQDFLSIHPPGRALDLGCGTGTNVITMAKLGWDVIGVDYAIRAIKTAKMRAQKYGIDVDLQVEDVTRLDSITGCFDLILDMGCFHSLTPNQRSPYIVKIDKLLADTGTFLLYLFFKPKLEDRGPGASETDIIMITRILHLIERKDSTERGIRPSAWFMLQKYH